MNEFVVSAEKRVAVVDDNLLRIQHVYSVRVLCSQPDGSGGDSGCILPCESAASGPVWVQVEGEKENCQKAKEYILSLCSENRREEGYSSSVLDMLDARIPQLEYESGAVITRLPGERLVIQGADENIVRAQSLITLVTASLPTDVDYRCGSEEGGVQSGAIPQYLTRTSTASPRSDSSDSIGNSLHRDEVDGRTRSSNNQNGRHSTPPRRELQMKATPSSSTNSHNKHEEIIALMQKLGYSRQIVEQVLQQIGDQASSNEVLQTLVSLGSPKLEDEENGPAETAGRASSSRDASDGVSDAEEKDQDPYRPVIIDGSNVAMSYGNKNVFACKGIDTVVMWFLRRGHKVIYVFVPSWRKEQSKPETPIQDQEVLIELEAAKILVWTPSRRVKGRRMVCYDDRYILNLALELDGIVVSNDTFRDLCAEKPDYRKVVEERLLMYSFAGDKFMPPDDPLGRHGPSLDNFLRKTPSKPSHQMQPCPYGKKCTYGNKCKYSHPERTKNLKPTSEILLEKDKQRREQRIKEDLQKRAFQSDPVVMQWNREKGGVVPDPFGSPASLGTGGPMMPGGSLPPHGRPATFPLAHRPNREDSVRYDRNTIPLMHHANREESVGYDRNTAPLMNNGNAPSHNLLPYNERWQMVPDQRGAPYHQHHRPQPLPDRSVTAPVMGYQSQPAAARESLTMPVTSQDYHHHHAPKQGKRYSLPATGGSDGRTPPHSTGYQREGTFMGDVAQGLQQLTLHEHSNHGAGLDDERHYTYPMIAPYRGPTHLMRQNSSNDFNNQTSLNTAHEDEGYYSPHNLHPQSHSERFMYPTSLSSTQSAAVWGQHAKPGNPAMQPASGGGPDQRMAPPPAHQGHSLHPVSPRRTSEPVLQGSVWSDGSHDRLHQAMRQPPSEYDQATQRIRMVRSQQQNPNPQSQS